MESSINPDRVRKALAALKDAQRELEAALTDAERPRPENVRAVRINKPRKSMRRLST